MQIFNTLTRQKEEFVPQVPGEYRIYVCGPTVYNFIHIGNARPICAFDVLRRYLTWRGYTVKYVQNFTDVDDKIIKRANEEGSSAAQVAEKYIAEYKTDAHGLNVMDADVHPQVTTCMQDIIDFVKALVDSGHAYEADGDVYFRTASFPELPGKCCRKSNDLSVFDILDQFLILFTFSCKDFRVFFREYSKSRILCLLRYLCQSYIFSFF